MVKGWWWRGVVLKMIQQLSCFFLSTTPSPHCEGVKKQALEGCEFGSQDGLFQQCRLRSQEELWQVSAGLFTFITTLSFLKFRIFAPLNESYHHHLCRFVFPFECMRDRGNIDPAPILAYLEQPLKKSSKRNNPEKSILGIPFDDHSSSAWDATFCIPLHNTSTPQTIQTWTHELTSTRLTPPTLQGD